MSDKIRIGTRKSPLAMWQANLVKSMLEVLGHEVEIIKILSEGDIDLVQPIYSFGITGVFTKSLDIALLNDKIDVAVHSLKDIPTSIPKGLTLSTFLKRDFEEDVLVFNSNLDPNKVDMNHLRLATGSLRRRAFWLQKYPETNFEGIRGNVQTRLEKVQQLNFDATIFSRAGLERMNLGLPFQKIDFMLPAVGQGVVSAVIREDASDSIKLAMSEISHETTAKRVKVEREFMAVLEGGCSAPIGVETSVENDLFSFKGILLSLDGKKKIEVSKTVPLSQIGDLGNDLAKECLSNGGLEIMESLRS